MIIRSFISKDSGYDSVSQIVVLIAFMIGLMVMFPMIITSFQNITSLEQNEDTKTYTVNNTRSLPNDNSPLGNFTDGADNMTGNITANNTAQENKSSYDIFGTPGFNTIVFLIIFTSVGAFVIWIFENAWRWQSDDTDWYEKPTKNKKKKKHFEPVEEKELPESIWINIEQDEENKEESHWDVFNKEKK